ncbi:MAG: hypothetical protein COA91_07625 [Robiginitomaculum sp.]|nr:MAG: hypothetical protein COA91_07625 [Robiginitomaculum sp.]
MGLLDGQIISLFAMMVSITALVTQLVFGVLSTRRAIAETNRQIAETKKQEKLHAVGAEEVYKAEVRAWGRAVVREMAFAQQLCKTNPEKFTTSDYDLERAKTVASLRGLLDKAKWLFPNLATPSHHDQSWEVDDKRRLSALESILYAYHVLDTVKPLDKDSRTRSVVNMRNLRKQFVREMRRAVDPQVRGQDIERIIEEVEGELDEAKDNGKLKPKSQETTA